jgi:two-component system, NarL family, response regulator DevR
MSVTSPIRVLIVDDSAVVRAGLHAILGTQYNKGRIEIVGDADTVSSAIAQARSLSPDVVLLDIRLRDESGLEACKQIKSLIPSCRILVLTSVATDELMRDAAIAGAQGFLMKEIDPEGLANAILNAHSGKCVLTSDATERVMRLLRETGGSSAPRLTTLSHQERKVLELVSAGLTNKEVGEKLGLSENTVKNYLAAVFEKLQVKRRSQAAVMFANSKATK